MKYFRFISVWFCYFSLLVLSFTHLSTPRSLSLVLYSIWYLELPWGAHHSYRDKLDFFSFSLSLIFNTTFSLYGEECPPLYAHKQGVCDPTNGSSHNKKKEDPVTGSICVNACMDVLTHTYACKHTCMHGHAQYLLRTTTTHSFQAAYVSPAWMCSEWLRNMKEMETEVFLLVSARDSLSLHQLAEYSSRQRH